MHWRIVHYPDSLYVDPFEINLILKDCVLKNNRKTAEKIFNGENKTVCSWVICESIDLQKTNNFDRKKYDRIFYNPKKFPYWVDENENILDGKTYSEIRSVGKSLYAMK